MNNIKYIFSAAAFMLSVGLTSCTSDLDVNPIDPNLKTKVNTKAESALNKCYATIAMAGNGGANGDSDVDGIDGGTSGLYPSVVSIHKSLQPTKPSVLGVVMKVFSTSTSILTMPHILC